MSKTTAKLKQALVEELPDSLLFKLMKKKKHSLENPKTFNEKITWLKYCDRKPVYTTMVDKYAVKQYVAEIIGEEHVIPTLGVWDSYDEIDFNILPNRFVLKCTHDSGSIKIIHDKSKINHGELKEYYSQKLSYNYYYADREWPYKNVKPRIIAEEYLDLSEENGLVDYKFFCFNNKPKLLYISTGMNNHATAKMSFYDLNGKELPFYRNDYAPYHNAILPESFGEMKNISGLLAKRVESPFIRIDLYSIKGHVYFSEFTFYPNGGCIPFEPKEWDLKLGQLLELPI